MWRCCGRPGREGRFSGMAHCGEPQGGGRVFSMTSGQLVSACWLVFLFYWIAYARAVKRAAERQSLAGKLSHRVPLWVGIILLFFTKEAAINHQFVPHTEAVQWLGACICVPGVLRAIWARRTLADNWSADVEFKQGHKLVVRGPYQFVRHPIYTSLLVMALGTAIKAGQVVGFVGVGFFLLGFWIKLKQEEQVMLRHFPEEYPAYKLRVKALVPFLW